MPLQESLRAKQLKCPSHRHAIVIADRDGELVPIGALGFAKAIEDPAAEPAGRRRERCSSLAGDARQPTRRSGCHGRIQRVARR